MDIQTLHIFLRAAQSGSFAATARHHDLDPSSVSRSIALLENELGVRLFERTTRQLHLTEAGQRYLHHVEPLLQEFAIAKEEAQGVVAKPKGHLRLAASVAFGQECIVPLLTPFRSQYPDITVELLLSDSAVDLVAEQVDLAIRLGPSPDVNLIGSKLVNTCYRVVASPSYIEQHGQPSKPSDITQHECLRFNLPDYRSRWLFKKPAGHIVETAVSGSVLISNALALRQAARSGMGVALLANWMVDNDIAQRRLIDLFPDYSVTATDFDTAAWLLYPSRSYLPKKVRAMIDFLKLELGSLR